MSPPRRLLLLCVALVAVVAVGSLVLARVLRVAPVTGPATSQAGAGPVLLVPGYGGSTAALEVLAAALRAQGRTASVLALPGDGTGDLRVAALALGTAADAASAAGAPSVDVVGYSAGGVTVRLWAQEHAAQARRIVTLGAPHHGTKVAALGAALVPGACPQACRQLIPGSDLLAALNRGDETPDGPQWMSVWTEQDQTVTPPDTAHLDGAVDVALQQLCPALSVTHSGLPRDPVVTRIVVAALSEPELGDPDRQVCG